jgi:hypothetical protein
MYLEDPPRRPAPQPTSGRHGGSVHANGGCRHGEGGSLYLNSGVPWCAKVKTPGLDFCTRVWVLVRHASARLWHTLKNGGIPHTSRRQRARHAAAEEGQSDNLDESTTSDSEEEEGEEQEEGGQQ